jgi:hypothetical protein
MHGALADIYGVHMTRRFAELADDAQRIHKRCRDITVRLQQDLSNSVIKLKEVGLCYFAVQCVVLGVTYCIMCGVGVGYLPSS